MLKKLIIRMASGKEHTIKDDEEMLDYYISDITKGLQKTFNTGYSVIFVEKIEEYRIELDYDSMS